MLSKRSLSLSGHRTSLALEEAFWLELERIAARDGLSLPALVGQIDAARSGPLASSLRLYVLADLRTERASGAGAYSTGLASGAREHSTGRASGAPGHSVDQGNPPPPATPSDPEPKP